MNSFIRPADDLVDAQVGRLVVARRAALGISQRALADRLGMAAPSLTMREQGKTGWTARDLVAAAEALDCSPADFLPLRADSDRADGLTAGEAQVVSMIRERNTPGLLIAIADLLKSWDEGPASGLKSRR